MTDEQHAPRVLAFDDQPRIGTGLGHELAEAGVDVVGIAATSAEMHELVRSVAFDVAVLDVLVGPSEDMAGLAIGLWLKTHMPHVGVLMFTSHDSPFPALRLLNVSPVGVGYLLKTRVQHTRELVSAIYDLRQQQNVFDSHISRQLLPLQRNACRAERLTDQDIETLQLIVAGKTNEQIAYELNVSRKTIDARCTAIFRKLGIGEADLSEKPNQRVALVVLWINSLEKFQRARAVTPIGWPAPNPGAPA
jgi:DNA-binding NarL/FixJ family response regulator